MKKKKKYIVINHLQVNFPDICDSKIIPQEKLFWNNTFSG